MNGYVAFDFKGPSASGWGVGFDRIRAYLDGRVIGETEPGVAYDRAAKYPDARTFEMLCSTSFTPLDILSGRLVVVGESVSGESFTLRLTDSRRFQLVEASINEMLTTLPEASRAPVRQRALGWPREAADRLARAMDRGETSPQLVPAGLRSPAGEAAVGRHGHLFFLGHDESIVKRYDADALDFRADDILSEWSALMERRTALASRFGADYLHVIVPEKLTALRRWAPVDISGPTPAFTAFNERFHDEPWHVDVLGLFESWNRAEDPYPTTDSRLSASGAQAVISAIARRVAPNVAPLVESIALREVAHVQGDLSVMMQLPFYSRSMQPETLQMRRFALGLQEIERSPGKSKGKRHLVMRWTNGTAPSKKKVQIFGGAVTGEGEAPEQLAWWLKHFFAEVRVDWRPDIDVSVIDEWQPDLIITQSVERDLTTVPQR